VHPILSHRQRRNAYLIGWLPVAGLLAALLVQTGQVAIGPALAASLPITYLLAFISLSSWYLCRALPLGRTPAQRLAVSHALAAAVSTTVWTGLSALAVAVAGHATGRPALATDLIGVAPVAAGVGAVLYLAAAAVHYAVASFEDARAAERATLVREMHARQAELRALRAQIDPHFLFNSLNAVGALALRSPAEARRMCVLLAGFFRDTMRLGGRGEVSFAAELALVRSFLAIEAVRFGDRLRIVEQVEPDALAAGVPPLLLQPLVENAVTHGIATLTGGGVVTLTAGRRGDRLEVTVENDLDAEVETAAGEGVGQANVQQRLAAHWGRDARLTARAGGGRYLVELSLPFRPAAPADEEVP